MAFNNILAGVLQAVAVMALAPLFSGLARVMRAKIANRKGPGILQDYRDIAKLLSRPEVVSDSASLALRAMPLVFFAVCGVLCLGVPLFTSSEPVRMFGDILTDVYLLALARFMFSLAGLDSGVSYAGMGSIRELVVSALIEPAMMLSVLALALLAGTTDIAGMGSYVAAGGWPAPVAVVVAGIGFALSGYMELGKVPFDAAEAEQEIQEGPLAELSGGSLAMAKLAMGMKQMLVASLFVAIFLPFGQPALGAGVIGILIGALIWFAKVLVIFLICGVVESSLSRVRFKLLGHQTWLVVGIAAVAFVLVILGI